MSDVTDVKASRLAATGTAYGASTRVRGYHITPGGTAGTITMRDGGAGGTTRIAVDITTETSSIVTYIPASGVRFLTDVHITLPTAAVITIFYG